MIAAWLIFAFWEILTLNGLLLILMASMPEFMFYAGLGKAD